MAFKAVDMLSAAAACSRVSASRGIGASSPLTPRQVRFATAEQVEALSDKLEGATDRALWATAIYAGLRRGELMALRREDVDLAAGVIHVRRG